MKQLNKKKAVADWKVCLIAAVTGLMIAIMAWCLTHLSLLLTWLVIALGSVPIWAQAAEWAKERYPHYPVDEALFMYLFLADDYKAPALTDEDDIDEDFEEDSDSITPYY